MFSKKFLYELPRQMKVGNEAAIPNAWGFHARLFSVGTGWLMQEAQSSRVISGIHTYRREESPNEVAYQGFCPALPVDRGGADTVRHRLSRASCSRRVT